MLPVFHPKSTQLTSYTILTLDLITAIYVQSGSFVVTGQSISYFFGVSTPPSSERIMRAFGQSNRSTPNSLAGGKGNCYQVDDTIHKPSNNDIEAQWVSELTIKLSTRFSTSYQLSVPRWVVDDPGRYVFDGWTASSVLPGKTGPKSHFDDSTRLPVLSSRILQSWYTTSQQFRQPIQPLVWS
ncbi:hypothetical protein BT63DRAFT_102915 [Microthyrium microscopicum]|uniref:Uncharacterized protein n=1 Tax=Microthyrium microscopicum TaxID=703497 RepID=A0A6A6TVR8_9PEZI|nr:hypothetical protein BT63DRAFT_102915 [Microthyrium microscopicum]